MKKVEVLANQHKIPQCKLEEPKKKVVGGRPKPKEERQREWEQARRARTWLLRLAKLLQSRTNLGIRLMSAITVGALGRVNHGLRIRAIPSIMKIGTLSTSRAHATEVGLVFKLLTAVTLLDRSPTAIVLDMY